MVRAFSANPVPAIAFISTLRCEDTGAVGVSKPVLECLKNIKRTRVESTV